jgi:hypothetical protein
MNYKIEKEILSICDQWGNKLRTISDKVVYATYDDSQKIFLITLINGQVKTKDTNGNGIRIICENAIEARFSDGTNIQVRRKDGRNEIRDKFGNQLRWI